MRARERLAGEVPLPTAVFVLSCVVAIALAGSWWWTMPSTRLALQFSAERAVGHAQPKTPDPGLDTTPQLQAQGTWTLWEIYEYSEAGVRTPSERRPRMLGEGLNSLDCLNGASKRLEALRGNLSGLESALIRNGVVYRTSQGNFSWKFDCLRAGELP